MTPSVSSFAAECAGLLHAAGDRLTRARCEALGPELRQADAAKAMMILAQLEEKLPELRRLMPVSAKEGQGLFEDLREIAR